MPSPIATGIPATIKVKMALPTNSLLEPLSGMAPLTAAARPK
jgi:hypothetical protein